MIRAKFFQNASVNTVTHTPHAPTLLESAAHNECQCHTIATGNRTENHKQILVIIGYT